MSSADVVLGRPLPETIDATIEALSATGYVADRSLATVAYLSLSMPRPLFLEGESGVGKTSLAKAMSDAFGRRLVRLQCWEGLDASSSVYEWNYAAQMMRLRAAEATTARRSDLDVESLESDLFSSRFLLRRPLLQAMESDVHGNAPILLIDEIDRADEAFEAFLLEALAEGQVTVPELGVIRASSPPLTVITSNRTRDVHDALKRRCLYHWADYPSADVELAIVRSRCPEASSSLSSEAVGFVRVLRGEEVLKVPGTAETLDWIEALRSLRVESLTPEAISATLGALLKTREDVERFRGDASSGLLERSRVL